MKIFSKINYPKVVWGVLSICFLWSAFSLLANMIQREFNFRLVSRGKNLELIAQCTLSSNITVREYIYHSSGGATTSDSNSVYIQKDKSLFEREIWSAYSSPFISDIKCDKDSLIINTDSYLPEQRYFKFSSEPLENELVKKPISFYKFQDYSQSKPEWAFQGEKDFNTLLSCQILLLFIFAFMTGYKAFAKKHPFLKISH